MDPRPFLLLKGLAAHSRFDLELAPPSISYLWCSNPPPSSGPGDPVSNTVIGVTRCHEPRCITRWTRLASQGPRWF